MRSTLQEKGHWGVTVPEVLLWDTDTVLANHDGSALCSVPASRDVLEENQVRALTDIITRKDISCVSVVLTRIHSTFASQTLCIHYRPLTSSSRRTPQFYSSCRSSIWAARTPGTLTSLSSSRDVDGASPLSR